MNNASASPILQVKNLEKTFWSNQKKTEVLKRIDLDVLRGEALGIVGPSGVGKSTLLHILGTLDKPTAGTVCYNGEDLFSWDDDRMASFRNRKLGFIFQFHHLLPEFTALENTMMPARIAGFDLKAAEKKARELLERMGLGPRISHKPGELSGGEQQRVAIARAIINSPLLLLADEPTGNLDNELAFEIMKLFKAINARGTTVVIATHNNAMARQFSDHIIHLGHDHSEKRPRV